MWERISKSRGKAVSELSNAPKLPAECNYIWQIYGKITHGLDKISYTDIDAYNNVSQTQLNSWEVLNLLAIDKIRIKNNHG